MNTHNHIKELLSRYVLEDVSPSESEAVKSHLDDCPECQKNLSLLQSLSRYTQNLQTLSVDKHAIDLAEKTLLQNIEFDDTKNRLRTSWWKRRVSIPVPIVAGFMLIVGLQIFLQLSQIKKSFDASQPQQHSADLLNPTVEPFYSEHGVYVAGIGFVEKSKTYDYFKETHYDHKL